MIKLYEEVLIMNNQYNKDGKKEGLWVKIYDNGVVQEERMLMV